MTLVVDIVTSRGVQLHEEDIDRIVIRRREAEYDPGSELAICPHHSPLLAQTQACRMRLTRGSNTRSLDVAAGVLEVWNDRVTLVIT